MSISLDLITPRYSTETVLLNLVTPQVEPAVTVPATSSVLVGNTFQFEVSRFDGVIKIFFPAVSAVAASTGYGTFDLSSSGILPDVNKYCLYSVASSGLARTGFYVKYGTDGILDFHLPFSASAPYYFDGGSLYF